ncbi:hypothetical protein [Hymenobacter latericus]|uniref:hypothetical protein n=1 Tax=Hymenobacter sp. YIM 151858-1 TaxID=2987688 RepID=UPI0022274F0C|nr:hypothetical protein [Hymenobacter sp. YIM 151858-1]UYZ60065.1 hypothetical protein OIS50_04515 [Hymenobacter sp. YIM 151858-1]
MKAPIYAALKLDAAEFANWLQKQLSTEQYGNITANQCTLALASVLETDRNGRKLARKLLAFLGLSAQGYWYGDAFRAAYGILEHLSGDADLFCDCYTA